MSVYSLARDVYCVRGAIGATLYDSRNGFLYHLDKEAISILPAALNGNQHRSPEEQHLLSELQNKSIIEARASDWKGDIHSIAEEPKIKFAWIEVTTGCNLRCVHCYESAESQRRVDMPMTTFTKIIGELNNVGVNKIQLIGGEPMMAPSLRRFLDYAVGKFDGIELFTNGTLITPAWVDYFKSNRIHVALSVYSYEPQSHDAVTRTAGSWAITNEVIKMLAKAGVKYRVQNVLLKDIAIGEKNTQLYTLSRDRDVVRMVGRANMHLLSVENIRKRLITKHSFSSPIPKRRVIQFVSGHNCFATHLYFSADGTIFPCVMERRISHGNINNASLVNLLKQKIFKFGKDCVHECRSCEFRYFCFDCRPDSMGGGITDKPWNCTYHPLTGKWDDPKEFIQRFQSAISPVVTATSSTACASLS